MKTEEIIKILLILGVLYLLFTCTTENFTDSKPSKIKLALVAGGKTYRVISFFNLKDEYKKIMLSMLKDDYDAEVKVNAGKTKSEDRTANSFFAAGLENAFISATPETIGQITTDKISKVPLLIIPNEKVGEYTNSLMEVTAPTQADKGLSPESGKFIYWGPAHLHLFYSSVERFGHEIKGLNKSDDKNKLDIEPIKIEGKDVIINKITEKSKKVGDLTLIHYVLSRNDGIEFKWKWYTDDLSIIQ